MNNGYHSDLGRVLVPFSLKPADALVNQRCLALPFFQLITGCDTMESEGWRERSLLNINYFSVGVKRNSEELQMCRENNTSMH